MEESPTAQTQTRSDAGSPVPEEDQPLNSRRLRRGRIWLEALTPLAIILAGASISAAVWLAGNDTDTQPTAESLVSAVPSAAAVADSRSLLESYLAYAREVGANATDFQQCLFDPASAALVTTQLRRGSELGVSGTPTFFINNKKLVGAQPASILQEIVDRELSDTPPQSANEYSRAVQALAATAPPRFEIVEAAPDVSDAAIEGDRSARVVIAEFSDFQCPFCQKWVQETLSSLRPQLGKDVALAFLHFPIVEIHPNAGNASVAAHCAGQQGKFWQMHDLLFRHQDEWKALRGD